MPVTQLTSLYASYVLWNFVTNSLFMVPPNTFCILLTNLDGLVTLQVLSHWSDG